MNLNFKLKLKPKNKQKVINTCYLSAVFIAFVLSLAHNNRVEASIDNQDYFSYLIVEDDINPITNNEEESFVDSPNSIKAMFDMADNLIKREYRLQTRGY